MITSHLMNHKDFMATFSSLFPLPSKCPLEGPNREKAFLPILMSTECWEALHIRPQLLNVPSNTHAAPQTPDKKRGCSQQEAIAVGIRHTNLSHWLSRGISSFSNRSSLVSERKREKHKYRNTSVFILELNSEHCFLNKPKDYSA